MEKDGKIILTREELVQINSGVLPAKVSSEWGLTLSEVKEMIRLGCYKIAD